MENKTKFTPGPWEVITTGRNCPEIKAGEKSIALVNEGLNIWRTNAQLIAAAPELYECLDRLLSVVTALEQALPYELAINAETTDGQKIDIFKMTKDNAVTALKKARGEECNYTK